MCGIAGYVTLEPETGSRVSLERMTAALRHRGPDGSGLWQDAHAGLGHRRLSIIDVAAGAQPMTNEDGTLWIVYNGEIFNHAEIRTELEGAGHRYRTHCDTETILHAYEQWGAACVDRFRGMFAFAIWDTRRRELFCARDRLGIKPFYYKWDGRRFLFASEIKGLLAHPSVSPALEEEVLPEYLAFGYVSERRTLFSRIVRLMPGHVLRLAVAAPRPEPEVKRYWDIPNAAPDARRSDADWIAECRRRLEETVRMRLMSDVPLGVFLSGGVDSTAIAALTRRLRSEPLDTFSVGYEEREYSELAYARDAAGALGSRHHEISVSRDDFFEALPRLIWHEDEPIAWPSSIPLHFVSALAARHVKVVLTGEGSDELFGGYSRYRFYGWNQALLPLWRLLPERVRGSFRERVAESALLGAALRRKLQHSFVGRGEDLESLYLDNFYSAFSRTEQRAAATPLLPDAPVYGNFLRYFEQRQGSALSRMLYADQKTYLVELLMKQDQMSMAASIESRVPFLDHPFVEFAASVPDRLKIRGSRGKYILREAVKDLIPRAVLDRPKMGFPTPLRRWLAAPAAAPLLARLNRPDSLVARYLDRGVLEALLERHRSGAVDGTDAIWRLLNLQIWGDVFLLGRREEAWDWAPVGAVR